MSQLIKMDSEIDPSRCQGTDRHGQCKFKAVGTRENGEAAWVGPKYCPKHQGDFAALWEAKAAQKIYKAALWQERIGQQANHPKVKSLREELGILRVMLNEKLESMQDSTALLMNASQITEITKEIGKLARNAHIIEKDMGQMLDKSRAEAWVQDLLRIISVYIVNPEDLISISDDMIQSLEKLTNVDTI